MRSGTNLRVVTFLLLLPLIIKGGQCTVAKTDTKSSTDKDGDININISKVIYMPNSSVVNTNTINGVTKQDQHLVGGVDRNTGGSWFGIEFSPLIQGGSNEPDLKQLLKVVQTRASSITTNDMGYEDYRYVGPWNKSPNSRVATSCAEMNRERGQQICSVLQGALVHKEGGQQLDLDAAFISAKTANGLFLNTVWGVKLGIGWERGGGFVKDVNTGYKVLQEVRNYGERVRGHNLKLGVFVGICGGILGGNTARMLGDLGRESDFFVCGVYPGREVNVVGDGVNEVVRRFEVYRQSYQKVNPRLEVILQTGWTGSRGEDQREFWGEMEKWAGSKGVRIYMHEAFDSVVPRGGLGGEGYWKMDGQQRLVESGTGKIVNV